MKNFKEKHSYLVGDEEFYTSEYKEQMEAEASDFMIDEMQADCEE